MKIIQGVLVALVLSLVEAAPRLRDGVQDEDRKELNKLTKVTHISSKFLAK